MRLKVQTLSPLDPLKAWLAFSEHAGDVLSVADLKARVCAEFALPLDVKLVLEDFELKDGSEIGIVRDGDLICVKQVHVSPEAVRKRKAAHKSLSEPPAKKMKQLTSTPRVRLGLSEGPPQQRIIAPESARPQPDKSSDSSSSASSSSSSDSPSSSSSDSDSESSSDSQSDSSPSSALDSSFSEPPALAEKLRPKTLQKPVPPGHGKPATHARNKRRRLKRMHAHAPPPAVDGANLVPLGVPSVPATPTAERRPGDDEADADAWAGAPVPMRTLKNKNKSKNFRARIAGGNGQRPAKIVFDDTGKVSKAGADAEQDEPEEHEEVDEAGADALPFAHASIPSARPPPLVPPSQRTSLPSNLFVTSVDVEADLWGRRNKRKANNLKGKGVSWAEEGAFDDAPGDGAELDYGSPSPSVIAADAKTGELTYERACALWESAPNMERTAVKAGTIIGWKDLKLNQATFTPELCLVFARVDTCSDAGVKLISLFSQEGEGEEEEQGYDMLLEWEKVEGEYRLIQ